MYDVLALIGLSLWLGLPAWIANSMPVIFGGGKPIDCGKKFRDGRRILGDGKTIRGFVTGVFWGTLIGVLQVIAAPYILAEMPNYLVVTPDMEVILSLGVLGGFLLSVGTLVGDMVGSFLKRRINLRSGAPAPILDQLGFILMALLFLAPIMTPGFQYVMVLIGITFFIHWISNVGGYLLGLKKDPW